MEENNRDFVNWPRTMNGDPVFINSQDARSYANLIINNHDECFRILRLRAETLFEYKALSFNYDPERPVMRCLASKNEFYKECLDEIGRICVRNKAM